MRLSLFVGCVIATSGWAAADPSLTIYNQNFAVVRDTVPLDLKEGVNEVNFTDTTACLEPDSVILRDPSGKIDLQILEQNYRNDPVSQELLLSLNEGQTIGFLNSQPDKPDQIIQGKIVRSGYVPPVQNNGQMGFVPQTVQSTQPIIEVNGKLQFGLPGQPIFPSLGDDTILKPTLRWKLQAPAAAKLDAELAYITEGLGWEASYNVVEAADSDLIDVVGWITMNNQSGKDFARASIKLIAGDVNRIQPQQARVMYAMARMDAGSTPMPQVTEKAFADFHLYSLPLSTDLKNGETKQVEFIHASGIQSQRIYIYDGATIDWDQWINNPIGMREMDDSGGAQSTTKVAIMRQFQNSLANHLGMPLPKGRLRFYKKDGQSLEFTGENNIDHTPVDETVKVYTGNAFDLVGERVRTSFNVDHANQFVDEGFAITLTNHKKEPVEIRVVEHLYRWINWNIAEHTDPFVKTNAQEIEFHLSLKPDEKKVVTYKVHYSW